VHDTDRTYQGTIAKSGTTEFLEKAEDSDDTTGQGNLIGAFGVGFYSRYVDIMPCYVCVNLELGILASLLQTKSMLHLFRRNRPLIQAPPNMSSVRRRRTTTFLSTLIPEVVPLSAAQRLLSY
jgi:hypothetical protein